MRYVSAQVQTLYDDQDCRIEQRVLSLPVAGSTVALQGRIRLHSHMENLAWIASALAAPAGAISASPLAPWPLCWPPALVWPWEIKEEFQRLCDA